ncbi:MAG TPA: NAD(P)H-binding protein [Woeseiaceae bacterium]
MTPSKHRVLLAGASGYIGRAVVAALLRRGHEVIALVRNPAAALPGCTIRVAEVTDADNLARALDGLRADSVISCLASRSGLPDDARRVDYGANSNLLGAARNAGVRRFVLLSAICVQRPRLAFQQEKLRFESELAASGIDYTIVRPTAFFKSLSGQVERVLAGKPFLVFGDGTQTACKPISEADLAGYITDCIDDPSARNRILPIGGPGPAITPRQQGELLFNVADRPPQFRRVPVAMFSAATGILGPLGKVFPAAAAKAELARIGQYYATESMLVWDERRGRYDADATPSTGSETLRDHYVRILRDGMAGQELGDHKLF